MSEKHNERMRGYTATKRYAALEILGLKCARCGFDDVRALHIDHVDGGGNLERKKMGTMVYYHHVLQSVKAGEKKFQILCANCNWIKRAEKNEKPYFSTGAEKRIVVI